MTVSSTFTCFFIYHFKLNGTMVITFCLTLSETFCFLSMQSSQYIDSPDVGARFDRVGLPSDDVSLTYILLYPNRNFCYDSALIIQSWNQQTLDTCSSSLKWDQVFSTLVNILLSQVEKCSSIVSLNSLQCVLLNMFYFVLYRAGHHIMFLV